MNITLIGMPGSGKSFVGKKIAEHLGFKLIELDTLMEERFNLSLPKILENIGEAKFLEEQDKDAILYTQHKDNFVVSPGGSIVYSEKAMQHLKKISKIIYLKTSFETIEKRVAETPRGIIGLKDKTLQKIYAERVVLYEKWADVTLNSEQDVGEILKYIRTMMNTNVQIIAEVKTQSPFGFRSEKSWDELFSIAERVGDIVSIHTDARWGGSFDLVRKAKTLTNKPILAKGIHATDEDIEQAIQAGADYVLVVGRIPSVYKEKCLIEPNTLAELKEIPVELKAVWNSRDLADGGLKTETFEEAQEIFKGWLCQASNIQSVDNIKQGADAVLIGTHISEFEQSLK